MGLAASAADSPHPRGTSAAQVEASPLAWKLAPGPHEVQSAEFELRDAQRGQDLPLKAYAPAGNEGPFPVIIFSHGAGGSRDVAPKLLRHWASHGYVVLAPSHRDSVQLSQERGSKSKMGGILRAFASDPELRVDRARDISSILDWIEAGQPAGPALLAGKLDAQHIGLGGHSAGAMTASLVAGATLDMGVNGPGGPETQSFRDPRVRALLLLSGQGLTGPVWGFHTGSWAEMTLPMMAQTGSHDNSPRTRQTSASRRHPYEYAPAGDKYMVFIDGALHMSFTGRASGDEPGLAVRWLEQYLGTPGLDVALEYDQRAIFDYVITSSQAFWDAYLKLDPEAKLWLQSDRLAKLSRGQVQYEWK